MKASQIYAPKPVNADIVAKMAGGRLVGTIASASVKEYDDGPSIILGLEGMPEGVPLNTGNARALIQAWGDETDQWVGEKILVTVVDTTFKNKPVKGLKVEPLPAGWDGADGANAAPASGKGKK